MKSESDHQAGQVLTEPPVPPTPYPEPLQKSPGRGRGWTPGRVVSVVAGSVLALVALGALAGSGVLMWAAAAGRSGGYLSTDTTTFVTAGRAITTQTIHLHSGAWDWPGRSVVGTVRIRVTASDPARPVFAGVAPSDAVRGYLTGSSYTVLTSPGNAGSFDRVGLAVPPPPATARIWTAQVSGTGTQTLVWTPTGGDWRIVAMNADASAPVSVRADIGATLPDLGWYAAGLLGFGLVCALGAVLLIAIPIRRASR